MQHVWILQMLTVTVRFFPLKKIQSQLLFYKHTFVTIVQHSFVNSLSYYNIFYGSINASTKTQSQQSQPFDIQQERKILLTGYEANVKMLPGTKTKMLLGEDKERPTQHLHSLSGFHYAYKEQTVLKTNTVLLMPSSLQKVHAEYLENTQNQME